MTVTRSKADTTAVWSRRQLLAWALIAIAVAYLIHVMLPSMGGIEDLLRQIGGIQLTLTILLALPMFLLNALYHADLVTRLDGGRHAFVGVFASYLQAQLVRYLPGKVWGLYYQTQRLRDTHLPEHVVLANLSQMLMTNLLALGVVTAVLTTAWWRSPWPMLALVPEIAMVEFIHRHPRMEQWAAGRLVRLMPQRFQRVSGATRVLPSHWFSTGILLLEWVLHFLMFIVLLHGVMSVDSALILGAWYAGASLIALAAIVVPGGIAVREAIFVSAASMLPGDAATLVSVAALLRLCLVVAEVLAAVTGTVVLRIRAGAI